MSERGSFVTEYIYCRKCFEACKAVLLGDTKYLRSQVIRELDYQYDDQLIPIIAGKVGGLYPREELVDMEDDLLPEVAKRLCEGHEVRVAVIADAGQAIYLVRAPDVVQRLEGEEYDRNLPTGESDAR